MNIMRAARIKMLLVTWAEGALVGFAVWFSQADHVVWGFAFGLAAAILAWEDGRRGWSE